LYNYDAFGNALGFDPSTAKTEFLYSGEQFDSKIGQQYLRQRYYDPTTGRFNRLDPFFGNIDDPQSLHKYLYTHGDPVNGVDPSGMMLAGMVSSFGIGSNIQGMNLGSLGSVYIFFNKTVRPILELGLQVALVYTEIKHFIDFIASANREYILTSSVQTRIKFNITKNTEITISPIGYRGDSENGNNVVGRYTHSVTVKSKLPLPRSMWTLGGEPAFQATFQVKHNNIANVIEKIAGTGSFNNRWEYLWRYDKIFVEIGCSITYNNDLFNAGQLPQFSVYGRLVYDYMVNYHSVREQEVLRTVIFQYRLGNNDAADSD
jgi:RHS repeat-associated protein